MPVRALPRSFISGCITREKAEFEWLTVEATDNLSKSNCVGFTYVDKYAPRRIVSYRALPPE